MTARTRAHAAYIATGGKMYAPLVRAARMISNATRRRGWTLSIDPIIGPIFRESSPASMPAASGLCCNVAEKNHCPLWPDDLKSVSPP